MEAKISTSNSKLQDLARYMGYPLKSVATFDLPAGETCPFADVCKTKADRVTGKLEHFGRITCYAAKLEAVFSASRRLHWANYDSMLECGTDVLSMAMRLNSAVSNKIKIVRIHASGDFYNNAYFQAWSAVASNRRDISFFGYTKNLNLALADKPDNFHLNYSFGSLHDKKWTKLVQKPATAFIEEYDKQYPNIGAVCGSHEKSHEDFFAVMTNKTFKLSIH